MLISLVGEASKKTLSGKERLPADVRKPKPVLMVAVPPIINWPLELIETSPPSDAPTSKLSGRILLQVKLSLSKNRMSVADETTVSGMFLALKKFCRLLAVAN